MNEFSVLAQDLFNLLDKDEKLRFKVWEIERDRIKLVIEIKKIQSKLEGLVK